MPRNVHRQHDLIEVALYIFEVNRFILHLGVVLHFPLVIISSGSKGCLALNLGLFVIIKGSCSWLLTSPFLSFLGLLLTFLLFLLFLLLLYWLDNFSNLNVFCHACKNMPRHVGIEAGIMALAPTLIVEPEDSLSLFVELHH